MRVVGVAKKAIMFKGIIFNVGSKLDLELTENEFKALEDCIGLAIENKKQTIQNNDIEIKNNVQEEKKEKEELIVINVENYVEEQKVKKATPTTKNSYTKKTSTKQNTK